MGETFGRAEPFFEENLGQRDRGHGRGIKRHVVDLVNGTRLTRRIERTGRREAIATPGNTSARDFRVCSGWDDAMSAVPDPRARHKPRARVGNFEVAAGLAVFEIHIREQC